MCDKPSVKECAKELSDTPLAKTIAQKVQWGYFGFFVQDGQIITNKIEMTEKIKFKI